MAGCKETKTINFYPCKAGALAVIDVVKSRRRQKLHNTNRLKLWKHFTARKLFISALAGNPKKIAKLQFRDVNCHYSFSP